MSLPEFVSAKDICGVLDFTTRTLHRRMNDEHHPFPQPAIKHIGAPSLWHKSDFLTWIEEEQAHTKANEQGANHAE